MKPVRLSTHAAQQALHRGATTAEIAEAIQKAEWSPAPFGRLQASRQFAYGEEWNGKRHAAKWVKPVFVAGAEEILVVTVYVRFGREEAT
jgi:hypothetical protein